MNIPMSKSGVRGFTLIELLVVIAIIGILATLVITQLAGAQVRARNSNAKSDVSQMGKAIEVWKTSLAVSGAGSELVINSHSTAVTGVAASTLTGSWATLFVVGTGANPPYNINIAKSPSATHAYIYSTSTPVATPALTTFTATDYCVSTAVSIASNVTDTGFWVRNGASFSGTDETPGNMVGTCTN